MADVDPQSVDPTQNVEMPTIVPLGNYVLIMPDKDKHKTAGGILLSDNSKIPVMTGRVIGIGAEAGMNAGYPLKQYQKVIYRKGNAVPTDIEAYVRDDKISSVLVLVEDILAYYET